MKQRLSLFLDLFHGVLGRVWSHIFEHFFSPATFLLWFMMFKTWYDKQQSSIVSTHSFCEDCIQYQYRCWCKRLMPWVIWIDCVVCVHHQLDNCTLWQSKFSLLYIRDQLNKSRHYHVRHLKRQHVCGWHGTQLASEFDCWGAELDWIHWFACHFMSANVGLRWVESRICQYAFTQWGGTQNVFHNKYTIYIYIDSYIYNYIYI